MARNGEVVWPTKRIDAAEQLANRLNRLPRFFLMAGMVVLSLAAFGAVLGKAIGLSALVKALLAILAGTSLLFVLGGAGVLVAAHILERRVRRQGAMHGNSNRAQPVN